MGKNLHAVLGDQCFVGCNHMFAMIQCSHNQITGNGGAANQFHDYINVGVFRDIKNIAGNRYSRGITVWIIATCTHLSNGDFAVGSRVD